MTPSCHAPNTNAILVIGNDTAYGLGRGADNGDAFISASNKPTSIIYAMYVCSCYLCAWKVVPTKW